MKKTLVLILKLIALTALFFILYMAGSAFLGPGLVPDPTMQQAALKAIPIVCLVDTLVLALVIRRSNWNGWKLILATAVSYYGVQTVMAQIETAYFGPALGIPMSMLPGLFLQSVPVVLIFIPLAVLILGKGRAGEADADPAAAQRLNMPVVQWAWKLAVIAVVYVVLYFLFGYFVAWSNPTLSAMYGNGADKQVFDLGRLLALQLGRGILWTLFTLPLIRMTKGSPWLIALIAGLLLALPMNIGHVIPNPIMPDPSVRLSHFIETASSNFIFGIVITHLVLWRPRPAHATAALPA
jgi:hypothetical protein